MTFLIYSILGTILHFLYNWSNKSIVVGIIASVNESIWEHIKILLTPILFFNLVLYLFGYRNNYFTSLFLQELIAIFTILILYKIKTFLFKENYPVLNIIIFYIASFFSSIIGYLIRNTYISPGFNLISMFGSTVILIMYLTFTIFPPKNNLFKDPITSDYGINRNVNKSV